MEDCIFCKIIAGEVETDLVYEDEKVIAFKDINQQAPVHLLIVPRKHIPSLNDLSEDDYSLVAYIHKIAGKLAKEFGIAEDGFRIVVNCNDDGGQTVYHIHFHLLGGRELQWPPG